MSSKQFRGKLCVYCCKRPAVTGDHIFARELFVKTARANLPQVPTCDACNNDKSKLEHYLTAVLPFGGRHPDAHENLTNLVPGRLAKNLRLSRELYAGRRNVWRLEEAIIRPTMTIPIEPERVCALFAYAARALAYYHWGVYLLPGQDSQAMLLSSLGRATFARLFTMNAAKRVQDGLGNGTVIYSGVQAVDTPQLTLWRLRLYGGLSLSGDPRAPAEVVNEIGAVTGPRKLIAMLSGRVQSETNSRN
jgi:hypothetical protein